MFEERNIKYWKKVKPMGMKSYILKKGLGFHTIWFFALHAIIMPLYRGTLFFSSKHLKIVGITIITSILFGLYISYSTWKEFEKKYD